MSKQSSGGRIEASPALEMVIHADRPREVYVPSSLLRPVAGSAPPPQVDPVAEALSLIQADMARQAQTGSVLRAPVTIRLETTRAPPAAGPSEASSSARGRGDHPPRPPPPAPPAPRSSQKHSIFDDDIEEYCLRVRGRRGAAVSDRFAELLSRQRAVQQQQQRLRAQQAAMRAAAAQHEAEAEAARRRRARGGLREAAAAADDLGRPQVAATTAADALLVLRERGGCGAADLCLTPPDLPRALRLIHRLRCEVLELRACALRTAVEKNELAAELNRDRARLRKTFTRAQLKRLLGIRQKTAWDPEDLRRAIALRRLLSRRQYRYVAEVMGIPLPALRPSGRSLDPETRRLYDQLEARADAERRPRRRPRGLVNVGRDQGLITVASGTSESEPEQEQMEQEPDPELEQEQEQEQEPEQEREESRAGRRRLKVAVTSRPGRQPAALLLQDGQGLEPEHGALVCVDSDAWGYPVTDVATAGAMEAV